MILSLQNVFIQVIGRLLRPWSVESLNGGSTDELKKAPVEKKIGQKLERF